MAEAALQEKYPIRQFVIPEGKLETNVIPAEAKEPLAPKPAESAPATEPKPEAEAKPEVKDTDEETTGKDPESVKRSTRSYERRVDRALRQRAEAEARAQALQKEVQELKSKTPAPVSPDRPKLESFSDITEYDKALEKWASENAIKDYERKQRETATQTTQQKLMQDWEEKSSKAAAQYDDFDEKVGELQPTAPLSRAIIRSDNGGEVAYYLATHLKEAQTLMGMDAESQIVEVSKLSHKLSQKVDAPKQPSKAPPPIAPVSGAAAVSDGLKPQMPFEEYLKVGNKMFRGR